MTIYVNSHGEATDLPDHIARALSIAALLADTLRPAPAVSLSREMDTAPLRPGDCSVNGWRG